MNYILKKSMQGGGGGVQKSENSWEESGKKVMFTE